MIFTKLRLAIGGLALAAAGYGLWTIHDALAERRVRTAVERLHVEHAAQEAERLRAAHAHHAAVAALTARNEELKRRIDVENNPRCSWDADIVRLLNAARSHGDAPGQLSRTLSAPAPSRRPADATRAGGGRN